MKLLFKILVLFVQLLVIFGSDTFDYCSLNDNVCEGKPHIACGTLQSKQLINNNLLNVVNITTVKFPDDEQKILINFINSQRNKIALGQTALPKGSNLVKTVWDDELELFAKSLAEIEAVGDMSDFCFRRQNGKVVYPNSLFDRKSKTTGEAVRSLLTDRDNYIENDVSTEGLSQTSHLIKMGCYFGYTSLIGIDTIYGGGIDCVYDFGMKITVSRKTYTAGEPCSACNNNVGCDSEFLGLCAVE